MKSILILLIIPFSFNTGAQIIEDFNRSELNEFNEWSGETTKFILENGVLRLYDTLKTGQAQLSRLSNAIDNAEWKWDFALSFNPSSSNFLDIYLSSENQDPDSSKTGYFVRIGSSSDNISLYYSDGSSMDQIIEGTESRLNISSVRGTVRVSRDSRGQWTLESRLQDETEYWLEGEVFDNRLDRAKYFIILCHYTSTRSDKFFLDNIEISGDPYRDRKSPVLNDMIIEDARHIWISFDEAVSNAESIKAYTIVPGEKFPATIVSKSDGYQLIFLEDFKNGKMLELSIDGILDLEGNRLDTSAFFRFIHPRTVNTHELIINEIMADPTPRQDLEEEEYIEIFNRTEFPLDLSEFWWGDENVQVQLSGIWIDSMGYILLKPGKTGRKDSLNIFYLKQWPSLNNTGDKLYLKSPDGSIIDSLYYENRWHEMDKRDGGWSLERRSAKSFCMGTNNWGSTENERGGTPGEINSINGSNTDFSPPELLDTWYRPESGRLHVELSENLYPTESSFVEIEGSPNLSWEIVDNRISIEIPEFPSSKTLYHLSLGDFIDCSGNSMPKTEGQWALISPPFHGDMIVNEVLFDVDDNGEEFIELYNASDKYLDINDIQLSIIKAHDSIVYSLKSLPRLFHPGSYKVITRNQEKLLSRFPGIPNQTILLAELSPLNNIESSIVLRANKDLIDSAFYHRDFHFELLDDSKGVSLERLFTPNSKTYDQWTSASSSVGYASPGRMNSHFYDPARMEEMSLKIYPKVIIPNNSGWSDIAQIEANFGSGTWTVTCRVYSYEGREIKVLSNNRVSGNSEILFWNGIMDNGRLAPMGIYLVVLTATNGSSEIRSLRGTLALVNRK